MPRTPGNKLSLGIVDGKGVPLEMTPEMRSTHLYICGSTGTGACGTCQSDQYKGAWPNASQACWNITRPDLCGENLPRRGCGSAISRSGVSGFVPSAARRAQSECS